MSPVPLGDSTNQPVGGGDVFFLRQIGALPGRHQLQLDLAAAGGAVVDRVKYSVDAAARVERHRGIGRLIGTVSLIGPLSRSCGRPPRQRPGP